jgi:hypothetical protein
MGAGAIIAGACGRRIRLIHNDPDINAAIELGYKRLVVERSEDNGITWSEVSKPSERPALEKDKIDYLFYDRTGDPDYLYRTRYHDPDDTEETPTGALSQPSDPIAGAGLAIQSVLTVEQLKQRYLFGLNLQDDAGNEMPDSTYQHYILAGIAWLEHILDMPILPTTFIGEKADYYRGDYEAYNFIQMENYPVLQLDRFDVQYPSGQNVVEFPQEWFRVDKVHGIIRIVPTAGTLSEILVGAGGSYLPAIYSGLGHLPELFSMDYIAGFEDGKIPSNILDIIGKAASLGPLHIFGDLIAGAGIATVSLSIDGLSQNIGTTSSATNAGLGARVGNYQKDIKAEIPNLQRYYKGIRATVG